MTIPQIMQGYMYQRYLIMCRLFLFMHSLCRKIDFIFDTIAFFNHVEAIHKAPDHCIVEFQMNGSITTNYKTDLFSIFFK